jgi:hypothetical protein
VQDDELLSKLFFLDTNTYVGKNFQFESHELERLRSHLEEDDCHLLITDVNIQEIRRHIKRRAGKAVAAVKRATREAMILRNTPGLSWHHIFEKVSADDITREMNASFDKFLASEHVEVVSTKNVDVAAVFEAYFSEAPPFASSGKKAEFPDAFVLHAINEISKKRGHKLYVVSNDGDFKAFCGQHENLISVDRLERLLDLVIKNSEHLRVPAGFADTVYARLEQDIQDKVREQLETAEFSLPDDWEREIDINETELETIDFIAKNLVDVSKDGAVYELSVRIAVVADLSIADYDRSPWDSEDKYFPIVLHNKVVQRYIRTAQVTVEIAYDDGIMQNAEVTSIDTDDLHDLSDAKVEQISYYEMDLSDEDEYVD